MYATALPNWNDSTKFLRANEPQELRTALLKAYMTEDDKLIQRAMLELLSFEKTRHQ
jgi:hypothetical protein